MSRPCAFCSLRSLGVRWLTILWTCLDRAVGTAGRLGRGLASWAADVGGLADRLRATGLLPMAWAEYADYFRVQLMHDTRSDLQRLRQTRRLRPSWLASDLAAWRARRPDGQPA